MITNDKNYVAILDKGISYKRAGEYKLAKHCYIQAINLLPRSPLAYYNLGKLLYIMEEYNSSAKSFKTALELGYDKIEAMRHLGHALIDPSVLEEENHIVATYRKMIDPYSQPPLKRATKTELEEYDETCVKRAIAYMNEKVRI